MLISGIISGLNSEGVGLLRHAGQVIFVPYTATGDHISCQIVRQHKNYAEAKLVSIEKPSSLRINPLCPYFGTCGGCQLQHMDYAAQVAHKAQTVSQALKRIGSIENLPCSPPLVAPDSIWFYRRHITLTIRVIEGQFHSGYFADDHYSFLPVSQCPLFVDSSNPILQHIQELVAALKAFPENSGKVVIFKIPQEKVSKKGASFKYFLQWHFRSLPANAIELLQNALKNHLDWIGCSVSTPQGDTHLGNRNLELKIENLSLHFSPKAFLQNHPEQSLNIYKMIQSFAQQEKIRKALDFYSGIGITTLLLAQLGIEICGVENNREAVNMARSNSARNGCVRATFECADVAQVAEKMLTTFKPDLVIVNPPRSGLEAETVAAFEVFKSRYLIYISCMPATLARDIKRLILLGYRLEGYQPFDMFPQTGHVETVAILKSS